MPYINEDLREEVEANGAHSPGELNYVFSKLIDEYIERNKKDYATLNDIIGVLECCKLELYRRIVAPYEDTKLIKNGEVFKLSI